MYTGLPGFASHSWGDVDLSELQQISIPLMIIFKINFCVPVTFFVTECVRISSQNSSGHVFFLLRAAYHFQRRKSCGLKCFFTDGRMSLFLAEFN